MKIKNLIRDWRCEGFRAVLKRRPGHDELLEYRFYDSRPSWGCTREFTELVFKGKEFKPAPMYAPGSDGNLANLLFFLSRDTEECDAEYFKDYTEDQIKWREGPRRKALAELVDLIEEADPLVREQDVTFWDNGGKSIDRYTALWPDGSYIGMNCAPFDPQGFGQHGGGIDRIEALTRKDGSVWCHLGKEMRFADLSADCQRLVLQDLKQIDGEAENAEEENKNPNE